MEETYTLALRATFAGPLLGDTVRFWMHESGIGTDLVVLPPNSAGAPYSEKVDLDIRVFRFMDLGGSDEAWIEAIRAASRSRPVIAVRFPDSAAEGAAVLAREARLVRALEDEPRVQFVGAGHVASMYGACPYDGERLAEEYLAALGSLIARLAHAARSPRRRVLALYCDGILWDGTCAEADPADLLVRARHLAVHRFAEGLRARGWELWLVGRGVVGDVRHAFDERPDLPLRWESFARVRVDWRSSVENLGLLIRHGGVDASEVVFLGDRAAAAAVVGARYPGVLAIELPRGGDVGRFLEHAWGFDASPIRGSTPKRQASGAAETARVHLHAAAEVRAAASGEFADVARLSEQVHHFNATASHVDAHELDWFSRQPGREVLSIRAATGGALVGALRTRRLAGAIRIVDWWLRAGEIGRGYELESLRAVGRRAVAAGVQTVEVAHVPRRSNEPVRRFLESVGAEAGDGEYVLSIRAALSGAVQPAAPARAARGEADVATRPAGALRHPRNVIRALSRGGLRTATAAAPAPPRTDAERWLARLWADLLGVPSVGVHDDFLSLGGDSLACARVSSRIRAAFGVDIPLEQLLDDPTLEQQARRLAAACARPAETGALEGATEAAVFELR